VDNFHLQGLGFGGDSAAKNEANVSNEKNAGQMDARRVPTHARLQSATLDDNTPRGRAFERTDFLVF
jgi:hypothetical protein